MTGVLLLVLFLAAACVIQQQGTAALYFVQKDYQAHVTVEMTRGERVVKVYVLHNLTDSGSGDDIYRITDSHLIIDGKPISRADYFQIDSFGWIYLSKLLNGINRGNNKQFVLKVTAVDRSKPHESSAMAMIYLTVLSSTDDFQCDFSGNEEYLCFSKQNLEELRVEENTRDVYLGRLQQVLVKQLCGRLSVRYTITALSEDPILKKAVVIRDNTSELYLRQALDREEVDKFRFTITCFEQTKTGSFVFRRNATTTIVVGDVDDNPPLFDEGQLRTSFINLAKMKDKNEAVVTDKDLVGSESYRIEVKNDPLNIVKNLSRVVFTHPPLINRTKMRNKPFVTSIGAIIDLDWRGEQLSAYEMYVIDIQFIDKMYIKGIDSDLGNTVTFKIYLKSPNGRPNKLVSYTAKIFRNAARYSEVFKIKTGKTGVSYSLAKKNLQTHVFDVTWQTGIVYLSNDMELRNSEAKFIDVHVNVSKDGNLQQQVHILVAVEGEAWTSYNCNRSCSFYKTEEACGSQCGFGAVEGKCVHRRGNAQTLSALYSTCTPNLQTCPDGRCDEVEVMRPILCPQDCTTLKVKGGYLNHRHIPPRGIAQGEGTCWCDRSMQCTCLSSRNTQNNSKPLGSKCSPIEEQTSLDPACYTSEVDPTTKPSLPAEIAEQDTGVLMDREKKNLCGELCKTIIASVLGTVLFTTYLLLIIWCLYQREHRRVKKTKQFSGAVSMSAVHSDYVEEQSRLVTHNAVDGSPKTITQDFQADPKWEISRDNIAVESNLGNGEFGKVVRAKYYQNDGSKNGFSFVAVKVVKQCASSTEIQNLWTEFNLLKNLNHPNIIKLIGFCLDRDLYIVVEYCEHGSLLKFLCKHRPYANWTEESSANAAVLSTSAVSTTTLTSRDLILFAWQIAKGMQYLSDLKIEHKCLAARNILVAVGKVIKIANCGLNEESSQTGSNINNSKWRNSVKWMAPESVCSQIFTTRSDVWSFGVVLWEIVTLGANPYPGILVERIYGLLKTGYRMDKPGNCSDELFAIMQKCWKTEPSKRPSFHDLANIFDRILQERSGYLDLNYFTEKQFNDDNPNECESLSHDCECTNNLQHVFGALDNKTYFEQRSDEDATHMSE